jgi:hypothetical protein
MSFDIASGLTESFITGYDVTGIVDLGRVTAEQSIFFIKIIQAEREQISLTRAAK